MKRICFFVLIALAFESSSQASAQLGSGIVFDPTQSVHAIEQIRQFEQLYTTASETRSTVLSNYNLVHLMSTLPSLLYRPYATPWTSWTNVYAGNTYGNAVGWISAANTGYGVSSGYQTASLNPAPRYPLYGNLSPEGQQIIAAQGATSDLSDGVAESNLQTLGSMRANSESRAADIRQMEASTYSGDPGQHTDMATLQRINQAALMQLHAQQDANQIAQAIALQQMIAQKQQQDALKAAFADAANYQQQYKATVQPLTSGYGSTMSQSH